MSSESYARIITEHLDEEKEKFRNFLNRLNHVVYIQFLKEYPYQYLQINTYGIHVMFIEAV